MQFNTHMHATRVCDSSLACHIFCLGECVCVCFCAGQELTSFYASHFYIYIHENVCLSPHIILKKLSCASATRPPPPTTPPPSNQTKHHYMRRILRVWPAVNVSNLKLLPTTTTKMRSSCTVRCIFVLPQTHTHTTRSAQYVCDMNTSS